MAERSYNGRNLLTGLNGDFENAPPFIAATTTTNRWIDGTAAGSLVIDTYKWNFVKDGGTASARFDPTVAFSGNHSIKIDATDASGRGRVVFGSNAGTGASLAASMLATYAIRVNPNRQYTLSYRIKGTNLAGTGGRISVHQHNSNGTRVGLTQPAGSVTGTLDWTLATGTFTTNINTQYLVLSAEQASAGIQTLWFDDISLTEVLPARTLATSRTTATNRVAVRDMGTALNFTGGDTDNVYTGVNVLTNIPSSHTISIWAKPRANGASAAPLYEADPVGSDRFYLHQRASAPASLTIGVSSWNAELKNVVRLNEWQHYVVVLDGTTGYFYRNGVLLATQVGITVSIPNAVVVFGNNVAKNVSFYGSLDEPRIWNRALTPTEIKNLYLHGAVPRNGLVGEYLFDEGAGTTALDTSGNGNHGTITGATYTLEVPLEPRASI